MSEDNPLEPDLLRAPPPGRQELDSSLEQARERIQMLQRQKDELERARGELEELRRRHDEFQRGRAEMLEALNRGLIVLEHELVEAQRKTDLVARTRETFKEQLARVEVLTDAHWTPENLKSELSKSLATIETARMEFNRACLRIDALQGKTPESLPPTPLEQMIAPPSALERLSLGRALKLGFAFTLPLLVMVLILVITLLVKR